MDGETTQANENQAGKAEVDPWAEAFAALDQANKGDGEGAADTGDPKDTEHDGGADVNMADTGNDGGTQNPAETQAGDGGVDAGDAGGLGDTAGADSFTDGDSGSDMLGVTEEELEQFRAGLTEDVRDQTIREVAAEFVKRGIRNHNGLLGATVDDEDICRRDDDGVPHFYNPDTGREFMGDNPRRQAQEWVDDYNRELAGVFNKACENYEAELIKQSQPQLDVLEFAGTYDSLDPIRRQMFDGLVEDYEIKDDNGDVIGYSIDLKKAMAAINKQVNVIQEYGRAHAPSLNTESSSPSGPALDMKNSAAAAAKPGEKPQFKSLAEAMEWEQDQLLAKMRKDK